MAICRTVFERRRRDRFCLEGKIRYVLDHDEAFLEGDIIDISALGLCFSTAVELKEGQEIIFRHVFPGGHRTATVVWVRKTSGNNYRVGLQFK